MIDLNSVFGTEGFGDPSMTEADLGELNKALSAGYDVVPSSMTGGEALRVQSLEQTLKVLTFKEQHAVMFRDIFKATAFSTVEEYSTLTEHGSGVPGFTPEGVAPESDDAVLSRNVSLVKYLGTTREVTHPVTLVKTIAGANAVGVQINSGTLKIMRDCNWGLYWGNSNACFSPNTVEGYEFDGLSTLIDSNNIYDMAGQVMDEADFQDLASFIAGNYGLITDMYCSPMVAGAVAKTVLPKERIAMPGPDGLVAGQKLRGVQTNFGPINIKPDVFLGGSNQGSVSKLNNQTYMPVASVGRNPKKTPPATATSAKAPTACASVAAAALAGSDGVFHPSQIGVIQFEVTACNRYGESAPTSLGGTTTITAGTLTEHTVLTITNAASVVTVPEYYNIYCTEAGGSQPYWVGLVAASSQANNGTTTWTYDGTMIPNTSIAFAGEMTPEVIMFKQLAPLMKMDLAIVAPAFRFMILLYGVLQLFAPKKWIKIINIKDC